MVSALSVDVDTANVTTNGLLSTTTLNATRTPSVSVPENGTGADFDAIFEYPPYLKVTSITLCVLILVFGVVGNIMVPVVIIRTKDMRNSTNIFLMNLSLADLLVLIICTPTVLVELNSRPETWVLGEHLCKIIPFVELTVAHASVLTILAITFERYYAICEPLRAGYVCTKARAIVICIITWLVAAFCTSPIAMISKYQIMEYVDGSMVPVCFTKADTFWPMFYFLVINTIFYLGPFVLLIFMYWVIARHLMADPGTNCSESAFNVRARKQVVAMLITVVVAFFLCLLPFRVFTLWIILAPGDYQPNVQMDNYYHILFSCRIMLYLNSAINPILYNLMSSKFRQGFKNLIPRVLRAAAGGGGGGGSSSSSGGGGGGSLGGFHRRRRRGRLRYSNTLSTTLSHSSTKVTILARTGSSLLLRSGRSADLHQQSRHRRNGFLNAKLDELPTATGTVTSAEIIVDNDHNDVHSCSAANADEDAITHSIRPRTTAIFHFTDQPESFWASDSSTNKPQINGAYRKINLQKQAFSVLYLLVDRINAVLNYLSSWFFCLPISNSNISPMLMLMKFEYELYADGTTQVPVCWTISDIFWTRTFFLCTITVFFFLPLITLAALYITIAKHLMANPGIAAPNSNTSALRYRRQVVMMLGTVVFTFFVCLLPYRALTLWLMFVPYEWNIMSLYGYEAHYQVLSFCRFMLYLNSAINPILYNLMSSKFRDGFRKLCGFKNGGCGVHLGRRGTITTTSANTTGLTFSSQRNATGTSISTGGGAGAGGGGSFSTPTPNACLSSTPKKKSFVNLISIEDYEKPDGIFKKLSITTNIIKLQESYV
ncbi:uncharacterized protein LOC135840669 [Planococcus citri]|uniref:uncharacterized protein LOC135840669 n=1 Tax=Planococcus citri TaxID=170843 RepID=UPI0031F79779